MGFVLQMAQQMNTPYSLQSWGFVCQLYIPASCIVEFYTLNICHLVVSVSIFHCCIVLLNTYLPFAFDVLYFTAWVNSAWPSLRG